MLVVLPTHGCSLAMKEQGRHEPHLLSARAGNQQRETSRDAFSRAAPPARPGSSMASKQSLTALEMSGKKEMSKRFREKIERGWRLDKRSSADSICHRGVA